MRGEITLKLQQRLNSESAEFCSSLLKWKLPLGAVFISSKRPDFLRIQKIHNLNRGWRKGKFDWEIQCRSALDVQTEPSGSGKAKPASSLGRGQYEMRGTHKREND
jgi:hypothetical protein